MEDLIYSLDFVVTLQALARKASALMRDKSKTPKPILSGFIDAKTHFQALSAFVPPRDLRHWARPPRGSTGANPSRPIPRLPPDHLQREKRPSREPWRWEQSSQRSRQATEKPGNPPGTQGCRHPAAEEIPHVGSPLHAPRGSRPSSSTGNTSKGVLSISSTCNGMMASLKVPSAGRNCSFQSFLPFFASVNSDAGICLIYLQNVGYDGVGKLSLSHSAANCEYVPFIVE